MPPETQATATADIAVDNPKQTGEKTADQQAAIKKLEEYTAMVNDENPQWYAQKGAKGRAAAERYRPVNIYPEYDPKGVESPVFAIERKDPPAAFKRKCAVFCEQFEKADAPPK